jgi:hypothetical protein
MWICYFFYIFLVYTFLTGLIQFSENSDTIFIQDTTNSQYTSDIPIKDKVYSSNTLKVVKCGKYPSFGNISPGNKGATRDSFPKGTTYFIPKADIIIPSTLNYCDCLEKLSVITAEQLGISPKRAFIFLNAKYDPMTMVNSGSCIATLAVGLY